jgi:hypothetical protein
MEIVGRRAAQPWAAVVGFGQAGWPHEADGETALSLATH